MGLAGLVAYVAIWDALAKTRYKGRMSTISADCWTFNRSHWRRKGFWFAASLGLIHLSRRPLD